MAIFSFVIDYLPGLIGNNAVTTNFNRKRMNKRF